MEVILKEDVAKLGSRGDVVKVAEGYGRNFLLPRKLAIEANEGNKAVIDADEGRLACAVRPRKSLRPRNWRSSSMACRSRSRGKSGENDQLFGSVTSSDLGGRADEERLQRRSPQNPAPRAAEDRWASSPSR